MICRGYPEVAYREIAQAAGRLYQCDAPKCVARAPADRGMGYLFAVLGVRYERNAQARDRETEQATIADHVVDYFG